MNLTQTPHIVPDWRSEVTVECSDRGLPLYTRFRALIRRLTCMILHDDAR